MELVDVKLSDKIRKSKSVLRNYIKKRNQLWKKNAKIASEQAEMLNT